MPVLLLLLALLLSPPARAQTLRYLVIDGQVEPLQINRPGQPLAGGLITELLQMLVSGSPLLLAPEVAPWLRLKPRLDSGELQGWVAYGQMGGPKHGGECAPTPIAPWRTMVYLREGLAPPPTQPVPLPWLQGKRLLLVRGYDYPGLDASLASAASGPIADQRVPSARAALQMLLLGRGDVVVENQLRARYWLQTLGAAGRLPELGFGHVVADDQLCLLMDRQIGEPVKRLLFSRLAALEHSGELAALVQRYLR